ncbi:MAG TPA: cellulose binding domain-containing protein, partial [Lachnospiraceae bacterium]|nr:cellulose binding domain-containing protein [Lachnospiraceae bacterium]
MVVLKSRKGIFKRFLCLLLCVTIFTTGIPLSANATTKATATQTKFVKAEPEVFVPSSGEKTNIRFNLENKRVVNVYVMDGKKVIANLVNNKEYKGSYVTHELQWDGKDDKGNYVNSGTYKVVIEPQGKYRKYKSITNVSVVGDNTEEIYIAPNTKGTVFQIYGKGGKKQGVKNVNVSISKDGKSEGSTSAKVEDNLWYAQLPMSSYSLYDLTATLQSSSGTTTSSISAVMHTFRVTDRLEYLAAAYYGDYKKDSDIRRDNGLYETYKNSGELVGSSILIMNPSRDIKQEITSNNTATNQHLGMIDQLQRTASMNPVSLTMGNNFYVNEDLSMDGYIPLVLSRSYNSMGESFHEFGMNWTNSYTYFLQDLGKVVAIRFEDGHIEYYAKNEDGSYKKPVGLSRELKYNIDGSYTLIANGISIYEFTSNGKIKEIKDLNGNATSFTYEDGLLSKVENVSGYFAFTYNKDGTIQSIKDSGDRETKYGYVDGLLTSYIDAEGYKTNYSYDSYNRLNKVVSPEGVVLYEIEYDSFDRVISKTIQGGTYKYSYNDKERSIECTEPNGNKVTFHYTSDYRIKSEEYSDGSIKYYYKESDKKANSDTASKATKATKVTTETDETIDEVKEENIERDADVWAQDKEKVSENVGQNQEQKFIKLSDENMNQTNDPKTNVLELQTYNMNVCTGSMENNTLYPQFRIFNTSNADIDLTDVTLRYYFTIDSEMPLNFFCDYSGIGAEKITGKFIKLDIPVEGANYYMEVGFTSGAGKLSPGSYVDLHTRIGKNDWSVFTPGDDYSQNTSTGLCYFDQVDMFYKGSIVWGKGSISGTGSNGSTNNNNNNNNNNENNSGNGSGDSGNTGNSSSSEEEIIPKGTNNLKLQMYNTGNNDSYANTIHPMMKLVNMGENMVKLSDITIRYYYTADNEKPQSFKCDWSDAGTDTVTGTFHKLEDTFDGADTYLEIGFKEEASYIDIGAAVDLHIRFAKDDWSNYDLTNDHSINPGTTYVDWKKVDVFVNGVKVWGEDLIPSEEEELEVEHMDYADSTYTPVRAEMYNRSRESRSNEISPRFRIYNTQSEPIRLSDLRLNYYYTADGPEEQIFEVDWAGIGGKFQTSISKTDVTCDFTEVNDSNQKTKCVADIGFTREDVFINPGEYLELQVRVHRPKWTKYVQSNDYSLNVESKDYEEWKKIAVFIDDRWAFGSIPLSFTDIIDPEPEKDTEYSVEEKESYGSITDKAGNSSGYTYDENGNITSVVDAMGNTTKYTYNQWNRITSITDALGDKTVYEYDERGNIVTAINAMGYKTKYSYNSMGCLTKITKANGCTELRTYDSKGNVITITDSNANKITYDYDKLNKVVKCTDGNGAITRYEYSLKGNLLKNTDALGYSNKFTYNKDGKILNEIDQRGYIKSYQYDKTSGLLHATTNALSGKETYQYDSMGKLISETAADGGITSYDYDLFGRLIAVTDAEGGVYTFTYDSNGNTMEEKDELGNVIRYNYDKMNRVIKETDALNNVTMYDYDELGRTVQVTNPSGGVTKYQYDKLGNTVETIDAMGNVTRRAYNEVGLLDSVTDAEGSITRYAYDKEGKKIKEIDALGNTTLWKYDKNGNLSKLTDANGNSESYQYDPLNRVTVVTDSVGNAVHYKYDAAGNKLTETDALGYTTSYKYDGLNNVTSITNALGKMTQYKYDLNGQVTKETDPNGNTTLYKYDKCGNTEKVTNALGGISNFSYDDGGRLLKEIDEAGNRITYQYDANGNNIKKRDARGNQTFYEYDNGNNLTKVTDPLGHITKYSYDYLGNVVQEIRVGKTALDNQTTEYGYDKNGHLTKITDSMGKSISYGYNSVGLLSNETGKDGKITKYQYDKVGNLKKITYSDSRSVSFVYDTNNKLKTMTDWNGATTYEYDANGQAIRVTDANNQTLNYTWTKAGQKKSIQYPSGEVVRYEYDGNGNITKVTDTNKGVTTYTYDALNQVSSKKLPNNAESFYMYNSNGWLVKRDEQGIGDTQETYTYEYDKNGNRTKEIKILEGSTETVRYTYDVLNQLTTVNDMKGTRNYTFDEFGNRTVKEETGKEPIHYTYNSLNQLVNTEQGSSVILYSYDERGNVIEAEENGSVKQKNTFDSANKLSKVVTKKDGTDQSVTTQYTYDGAGNRVNMKVHSKGNMTSNTSYVIDPESTYNNIIIANDVVTGKTSEYTFGEDQISVETGGN